jgi:hypothetical protein
MGIAIRHPNLVRKLMITGCHDNSNGRDPGNCSEVWPRVSKDGVLSRLRGDCQGSMSPRGRLTSILPDARIVITECEPSRMFSGRYSYPEGPIVPSHNGVMTPVVGVHRLPPLRAQPMDGHLGRPARLMGGRHLPRQGHRLTIDRVRDRSSGITRSDRPHPRALLHRSHSHWSSASGSPARPRPQCLRVSPAGWRPGS